MDSQFEDAALDENPWSDDLVATVDEVVVPTGETELQDDIEDDENVWEANAPSVASTASLEDVSEQREEQAVPVTESDGDDDIDDEDDEDDDDFGSFEERHIERPEIFTSKSLGEILDQIFPTVEKGADDETGLLIPTETYSKLTSSRRVLNPNVQYNSNMMNYWERRSATNDELRSVIRHWNAQEEGVLTERQQRQQAKSTANGFAIFNWSTSGTNQSGSAPAGKKYENKSHQDKLLRIVADEVHILRAKENERRVKAELERAKRIRQRQLNKKNLALPSSSSSTPPLATSTTLSPTKSTSPSKKKFTLGNLFKFNKKSSISRDHISSATLSNSTSRSQSVDPVEVAAAQSAATVDLAAEFANAASKSDVSEAEDDDDDDDLTFAYNNLGLDEMMDDGPQEDEAEEKDSERAVGSTSLMPPPEQKPAGGSNGDKEVDGAEGESDDDFQEFVKSPSPIEQDRLPPQESGQIQNSLIDL